MAAHLRSVFAFALSAIVVMFPHAISTQTASFFTTGQFADLLLSGFGFNRTGGPLRFNHPGGIAVVDGNLVLADRNNNRVLIWSGIPSSGTTPPSLVLGQSSFETNAPGAGLDSLNWPTAVATDGTRLYVADTYNDRVLVWLTPPVSNKEPADFALTNASGVSWPWGIWTNGQKLAVSSTNQSRVLIWNSAPMADRAPDLVLRSPDFGTPRAIESDGTRLLVSDHNAVNNSRNPGNFFWNMFPTTSSQPHDFFFATTPQQNAPRGPQGEHIHDAQLLPDGRLIAVFNQRLCIWSTFPMATTHYCDVVVGSDSVRLDAGDNSGVAVADGRLFLSLNNGNRVLVYNTIPSSASAPPDYAIGSLDINTNTLDTDYIITNPVPLTDGERLWISSDYDRRLHVWNRLPSTDAQSPDYTYQLDFGPWANARYGRGVILVGGETIAIWTEPPTGQQADTVIRNTVGGTRLSGLRGVAYDGTYFALSSYEGNRVWVWRGVPSATSIPIAEITLDHPSRLASDGRYLAIGHEGPQSGVSMYELNQLATGTIAPVRIGQSLNINLPQGVTMSHNALFVADTNNNRVLAWKDAADAHAGANPDAVLGATDLVPVRRPAIGQNTLFWPGAVAYDGERLWVGEFKFGNRVVRFTHASPTR